MDDMDEGRSKSALGTLILLLIAGILAMGVAFGYLPPIAIIILFIAISILRGPRALEPGKRDRKIKKKDEDWGFDFDTGKDDDYSLPKTTAAQKDREYSLPKNDKTKYGFPDDEIGTIFDENDDKY